MKKCSLTISLDDDQRNTILAALRVYQGLGYGDPNNRPPAIQEIACPDDGESQSLDDEAIDELCQAINFS